MNWRLNPDMENEQWVYKDEVMIDTTANGKYIVNVFYEPIGDFIYFDIKWDTIKEAKEFVESIFK